MALPLAVASLALGAYQAFEGMRGLRGLGKQRFPNYSIRPEIMEAYGASREAAKRGLTSEEMAKARMDIAGVGNRRYTLAKDMSGGNLSRSIQNAINYSSLGAYANLADIDSRRHQENIRYADSMAKYIQGEQNRATSEEIRKRYAMESAYGGAFRTGTENIANSLNLTQALNWQKDLLFGNKSLSSPTQTFGEKYGMTDMTPAPSRGIPRVSSTESTNFDKLTPYYNFGMEGLRPRQKYFPYAEDAEYID